jgi:hypothetical protein
MPKAKKIKSKNPFSFNKEDFSIVDDMPDFSKDPVFVAKQEKAEKFIAEYGVPETSRAKKKVKDSKKARNS